MEVISKLLLLVLVLLLERLYGLLDILLEKCEVSTQSLELKVLVGFSLQVFVDFYGNNVDLIILSLDIFLKFLLNLFYLKRNEVIEGLESFVQQIPHLFHLLV